LIERRPNVEFATSIDIQAPHTVVWRVMSDIERWHEWTPSVRSIRKFGDGPLAPGTRALVRQPKFPPAMWTVETVVVNSHFVWRSRAPFLRVIANHAVTPTGTGTRATLSITYEGWLGRWMARMTRAITERYLALEARGLKERSEAQAGASS
jgi:hypothetical protein